MDTSDFNESWEMATQVLGRSSTPHEQISPKAWLLIIEGIYETHHIRDVPGLFRRFGDLMDDVGFLGMSVPRGKTKFEQGIGVNTLVHLASIAEENLGAMLASNSPRLTEFKKQAFLVLIKPEEHKPCRWALWTLSSSCAAVQTEDGKGYKSTVTASNVYFLEEAAVLDIFKTRSYAARHFCRISSEVIVCAEQMKDRAHALARFGEWLRGIDYRLR